jgi:hypothetical protein
VTTYKKLLINEENSLINFTTDALIFKIPKVFAFEFLNPCDLSEDFTYVLRVKSCVCRRHTYLWYCVFNTKGLKIKRHNLSRPNGKAHKKSRTLREMPLALLILTLLKNTAGISSFVYSLLIVILGEKLLWIKCGHPPCRAG